MQRELLHHLVANHRSPFVVVLLRVVRHFVQHPVRIDVVHIAIVPVVVSSVFILIVVTQPRLIKCRGKRHQVFGYVGPMVGYGRSVFHIFAGIGHLEVQIQRSGNVGVGPQVDDVACHVCFGDEVFVAHVGIGSPDAGLAHFLADDERVGSVDSRAEKAVDIVLDHNVWACFAVEVSEIESRVYARPPVAV